MRSGRLLIWILVLVPFFGTSQTAENACFSVPGGFYEESFTLEIFPFYQNHHIRFTTNGNRPTAQSQLYTEPLLLDGSLYSTSDIYTILNCPEEDFFLPDSIRHCIVIRAAVFDENDSCVSEVATNSYFVRALGCDTHGLPAVSLCADSLDLFDNQTGIFVPGVFWDPLDSLWTGNYYQSGDNWERIANIEFYEFDNTGVNQQCGLRTHGGNSRRFQQKGMKVYARDTYGNGRFNHRFFDGIPQESFKHLVIKPFRSSWFQSGITNHLSNQIAQNLNLESLSDRPAVVFLNGEYWGVYFIQEKPDERYLQDHFGIDPSEVNIIGNYVDCVVAGNGYDFFQFYDWLKTADLSDISQWEEVEAHVDIDCFIDYQIFELFIENMDWPSNNMRCWQHNDGRWRWIFYDGDACFSYGAFDVFANAVYEGPAVWPSSTAATLFFRKFLQNQGFKERFNERFNELMDGVFQYSQTLDYLTSIQAVLQSEVPCQSARFGFPESLEQWNHDVGLHQWFLSRRVEDMRNRLGAFWVQWEEVDETVAQKELEAFPNPFDDRLTLRFNSTMPETTQLQIFNVLGQEVYEKTLTVEANANELEVVLPLKSGVYFLKIGNQVTKIVRR